MFNNVPQKLIIVGSEKTDVYCEYLSMLISNVNKEREPSAQQEQKGAVIGLAVAENLSTPLASQPFSIDSAIWTDEIYRDNRAHTSSRQRVVFIGKKGCVENVIPNIYFENVDDNDVKEDIQMGIYCGFFGNKACIYVDERFHEEYNHHKDLFVKKYEDLARQYESKIKAFVEKKHSHRDAVRRGALVGTAGYFFGLAPLGMIYAFKKYKRASKDDKILLDQAYRYAVLKFHVRYLKEFME